MGQTLRFYGKNNKSLKQAIPGNHGHEPTLMTPSSVNISTEVDLLIIRADGLLLVKQPFTLYPLTYYRRWSPVVNQHTDVFAEHNCSPPNTVEERYTVELLCVMAWHGQGNYFSAALCCITS